MLILYFIILGITVVLFLAYYTYLIDVVFGGHDFATTRLAVGKVGEIIKINNKAGGVIYDLGSCRGGLIFRVLKRCPSLKAVGIDNSAYRVSLSKLGAFLFPRRAQFLKSDIFAANVSGADVVYVYLDPSLMPKLEDKLKKELKPGAMVILNTQTFPTWPAAETYVIHPAKPRYEKLSVYFQT